MQRTGETPADPSNAVASQPSGELLVVCSDGAQVRVPLPA